MKVREALTLVTFKKSFLVRFQCKRFIFTFAGDARLGPMTITCAQGHVCSPMVVKSCFTVIRNSGAGG